MPKLLIFTLTPLLLASYVPTPPQQPAEDYAESSSSRGCPIPLPTLQIDEKTLPHQVKFRLVNGEENAPILFTIYALEGQEELIWDYEGQGSPNWTTLTLTPKTTHQTYELTGVVPCKGDTSAGQVVRVRF